MPLQVDAQDLITLIGEQQVEIRLVQAERDAARVQFAGFMERLNGILELDDEEVPAALAELLGVKQGEELQIQDSDDEEGGASEGDS